MYDHLRLGSCIGDDFPDQVDFLGHGNWSLSRFFKKIEEGGTKLMALLEVKQLTKHFGGLTAVGDVTLELNEGELVGLIGPNGAGKTTLFNLLTGVYEPSEGTVTLDGHLLNGKTPYKIASLGLSRTFQNIRLFKDLTVLENVLIAFSNHHKQHVLASFLRLPAFIRMRKN